MKIKAEVPKIPKLTNIVITISTCGQRMFVRST